MISQAVDLLRPGFNAKEGDAIAEGIQSGLSVAPRELFLDLWSEIYGDPEGELWCWVYDLKRVTKEAVCQ